LERTRFAAALKYDHILWLAQEKLLEIRNRIQWKRTCGLMYKATTTTTTSVSRGSAENTVPLLHVYSLPEECVY
jgi:hypothetical protein